MPRHGLTILMVEPSYLDFVVSYGRTKKNMQVYCFPLHRLGHFAIPKAALFKAWKPGASCP